MINPYIHHIKVGYGNNEMEFEMPSSGKLSTYLLSARVKTVLLPEAMDFDDADFSRLSGDLIIKDKKGYSAFIRGFFEQPVFPSIANDNGEQITGDMAAAFVKLSPCALAALQQINKMEQEHLLP